MFLNKPRALDVMERNNLDALVVTMPRNVGYVSNYHPFGIVTFESFAILPKSDSIPPTLITGTGGLGYISAFPTWMENIITYEEYHYTKLFGDVNEFGVKHRPSPPATYDPLEALAPTLKELGLDGARLGIDDLYLAQALKDRYSPNLQAVGARELLKEIRMVKSQEEIKVMREGARMSQECMDETIAAAGEGATATELEIVYRDAVSGRGGESPLGLNAYSLMSWFNATLKKGAMSPLPGIATYWWYLTDCGRTITVGEPTKKQVDANNAVMAAGEGLDEMAKPGVHTHQLFAGIREAFARAGGDNDKLALYIHGIGLEAYERNHHEQEPGFVLEPGVTFCTFLMLMAPEANGAIMLEEETLVTEDGCEQLYTLPRELIVV